MWLLSSSHKTINFMRAGNVLIFLTLLPVPSTVPDIVCAKQVFLEGTKRREVERKEEKEGKRREWRRGSRQGERQKRRNGGPIGANWKDIWFSISNGRVGRVKCSSYLRPQCLKAEGEHQNFVHGIMLSSNHRSSSKWVIRAKGVWGEY